VSCTGSVNEDPDAEKKAWPAPMLPPRMKSVRGPDAVKASDAVGLEVQPVVPKVRGTAPVELTFTVAVAGASAASSSSTLTLAQPSRGTLTDEGVVRITSPLALSVTVTVVADSPVPTLIYCVPAVAVRT